MGNFLGTCCGLGCPAYEEGQPDSDVYLYVWLFRGEEECTQGMPPSFFLGTCV